MPAWGGGGSLIAIPSVPSSPASIEFAKIRLAATNTNPFTAQQQHQDWGNEYMEASVLLPPLLKSQATAWVNFLIALKGPINVFQFTAAFAAAYAESLTSDGTTQRYWRLKSNEMRWSIHKASLYGITFECREAL